MRGIMLLRKTVSGLMLALILIGTLTFAFNIQRVKSEPRTIVVPDDYPKIQIAIDYAKEGDEILVKKGVYYENVVVNKAFLKIFGENRESVIQGNVAIIKDNVSFEGFTIIGQNQGIKLDKVNFCTISNCNISNNNIGVSIYHEPSMLSQLKEHTSYQNSIQP
jgi:pectin methylesterase-like acyl-CoA thioesterase